jgi:uncharacterized protein
MLICSQWRPLPERVWIVDEPVAAKVLAVVSWTGWAMLLTSTFLISHFRLFGLSHGFSRLLRCKVTELEFVTPFLYRYPRHRICATFILTLLVACVSQAPAESATRRLFDVQSPMRDGVDLSADVWLPPGAGKYPLILMRTPYLKAGLKYSKLAAFFVGHGYAFAVQDVRGRGDSKGQFNYDFQEADDGYDTVEWMAAQSWSNGRVCMMGASYLGAVQWQAAKTKPPHLVCIVPTAAPGDYMNEVPYVGGAFMLKSNLEWHYLTSGKILQANLTEEDLEEALQHRPLLTADEVLGLKMPGYRQLLEHPTLEFWKPVLLTERDFRNMAPPALQVTGWFDICLPGTIRTWRGMAQHSPAAGQQYLIVGPWDHGQTFGGGARKMGEMEFTPDSVIDNYKVHLEFFDRYLKQQLDRFNYPRVKLYVTGRNQWRNFDAYPVPEAKITRFYMSSAGRANSLFGDGKLIAVHAGGEPQDQYAFNPKEPVPLDLEAPGGAYGVDRRALERRDDVLVYTGAVLDTAVEVIGQMGVELYAASDARDTDFTASIIDVYPDGRAVVIGARVVGIIRARYRTSLEKTDLLTPGKVEQYRIDLGHTAHSFQPGHRVRVEISSSAAPWYNPNQNTGHPVATDVEWRTAHQTIYHDAQHPSALLLPVMPADRSR